jgi:predicted RNA-binding protein YlqC (UPF0109 family)
VIYEVTTGPDDLGRILGKEGRIVRALHTLLIAMWARDGKRVEIVLPDSQRGHAKNLSEPA